MKLSRLIFPVMVVLSVLLQIPLIAQAQPPTATKPVAHTYRVTYTLTDMDGTKKLGSQQYAITVSTESNGTQSFKLGSRIPIPAGSYSAGAATGISSSVGVQTQFSYYDVGLNIRVRLEDTSDGRVSISSNVDQSSLMENNFTETPIKSVPVVRQMTLENTSVVSMGAQMMLGSLDIPGSTRHVNVEVVVNRM